MKFYRPPEAIEWEKQHNKGKVLKSLGPYCGKCGEDKYMERGQRGRRLCLCEKQAQPSLC